MKQPTEWAELHKQRDDLEQAVRALVFGPQPTTDAARAAMDGEIAALESEIDQIDEQLRSVT